MAEYSNLKELVDFLIQTTTEHSDQQWCFLRGKLYPADSEETFEGNENDLTKERKIPVSSKDRCSIMKRFSSSVKSNMDALLKVSKFQNNSYDSFIKNDILSMSRYFDYFAKWARKISYSNSLNGNVQPHNMPCVILDKCPIFSTLSRFIASHYAALNNVNVFVEKKYLLPALSLAFLLHKAGVSKDEINIYPFQHPAFPKKSFSPSLSGVVRPDSLRSVETTICGKLNTNNVYFRSHSASPFLILKSSDIDSAVKCVMKSTRDLEALWFPNIVYIEESELKTFLDILKFAVDLENMNTEENLTPTRKQSLNAMNNDKKSEGYEVITLHHLFHSCSFIVNYDFSLLSSSYEADKDDELRFISIVPIRYDTEGVAEINKNKGVCASVWTNDVVQAISIPITLKYGTIWINCVNRYDPSVPFAMWNSHGVGSFSGKRMVFENLNPSSDGCLAIERECLYDEKRNLTLPKRTLSDIVKKTSVIRESWGKTSIEERLSTFESIATSMEKNWTIHYKIVFDRTSDDVWKKCIDNLYFWPSYLTDNEYDQTMYARNCSIVCKSEPIGIVAILAGTISLDRIFFYVTSALAFGNTVIVGLSTDESSSAVAVEFEKLFDQGLVTVLMGTRIELWRQFTTNSNIGTLLVYRDAESSKTTLTKDINHQIVYNMQADHLQDFEKIAERIEMLMTKAKCVWYPQLGGTVDETYTTY